MKLRFNGSNLANFLKKKGIKKGDRVLLMAYNCIEFAEIIYAISKLEAILLPINYRLSVMEIIDITKDASPTYFIFQKDFSNTLTNLIKNKYIEKNSYLLFNSSDKKNIFIIIS